MSERKVLNKYYPPDFDPSKIPKLREAKNKVFSIRIMAPFNMRCNVCGEYIYKGKKFNSRKENVDDEDFLGLRIFRFYIRCPKCVAEIAFKTDLKNTDYTLEAGATRLFEAEKLAQQMAEQERLDKEAEELNPMKVLENRTKASHREMAQIDELEELREISARHAKVDTSVLLEKQKLYEEHLQRLQQEEEDRIVESIFGSKQQKIVKRLADSDSEDSDSGKSKKKKRSTVKPVKVASDLLVDTEDTTAEQAGSTGGTSKAAPLPPSQKKPEPWQRSVGNLSVSKKGMAGLVRKKQPQQPAASKITTTTPTTTPQAVAATTTTKTSPSAAETAAGKGEAGEKSSHDSSNNNHNSDGGQGGSSSMITDGDGSSSPAKAKAETSVKNSGLTAVTGSALGLLGDYSDSESAEESS